MLSSVVRAKSFVCLLAFTPKVQAGPLSRIKLRRTLFTSKTLTCGRTRRSLYKELDLHEYVNARNDPKDLGKIVSLELDQIEQEEEEEEKERRKIKKRKKHLTKDLDEGIQLDYNQVDDADEGIVEKSLLDENIEEEERIEDDKSPEAKKILSKLKPIALDKKSRILCSVMSNLKSKVQRQKQKKIVIEGKRLIHDAISAGYQPQMIFFSRVSDVEKLNLPDNVELYQIPYKKLQLWSDVVTSQGIIGVFPMPDNKVEKENEDSIPLTVICDNIREPGNLGSVLRVLAGVGCRKIILTKGCVDLWESKVLRSAAGAHFRLSILRDVVWSEIEDEVEAGSKIVLTDSRLPVGREDLDEEKQKCVAFKGTSRISEKLPLVNYNSEEYSKEKVVVVIGGETHGLSEEAYQFAVDRQGVRVFIPMSNNVESLNISVALGIVSYEIRRQIESVSPRETSNEAEQHQVGVCAE